ncbi:glycerophosphodiester phosphodiesterase family protein [Spirosoma profusum]|uniref:glycerophosphodiester phosphodiesterase family protein n=1 Tax=Spirosoma profusum TaxID=2771354 RepID=UPI00293BDBC4|nr:glycerophosphodiester phosphodiesterase family protein [Spirosoma profusum]
MKFFALFIIHFTLYIYGYSQPSSDSIDYFRNQFVTHPKMGVSTHRGNSNVAPENTLATYRAVLQMKADYIEIDVRTTKDGKLIILHDGTLDRTTNGSGPVSERTLDELKKLSAAKGADDTFQTEQIPTLDEVCQLVADWNAHHSSKTNLYVDCKAAAPEPMVAILTKYGLLNDAVFYGSDNYLASLRNVAPTAKLMPSLRNTREMMAKINQLHPFAFDVSWASLTDTLATQIHQQDIRVFVDLLGNDDTSENYAKAARLGVDVIQTDHLLNVYRTFSTNTTR